MIREAVEASNPGSRLADARLRLAVEDGNLAGVEQMLKDGADPDLPGPDGMTAALIAEFSGKKDILELIDLHRSVQNRLSQEKNARPAHWDYTPVGFTVGQAGRLLREVSQRSRKPAPGDTKMAARLARSLAAVDSPEAVAAIGELLPSRRPQYRQLALESWNSMACPTAEAALKRLASFWTTGKHDDKVLARKLLKQRAQRETES